MSTSIVTSVSHPLLRKAEGDVSPESQPKLKVYLKTILDSGMCKMVNEHSVHQQLYSGFFVSN